VTHVLVVEDEASFSDPLSYLLAKEGYEVDVVENGPDALAFVERRGTDLVLLDLMLPGLSGTEVCRRIRSVDNHDTHIAMHVECPACGSVHVYRTGRRWQSAARQAEKLVPA
jgi:DNA-binding response OmpR family regulator